MDIQVFNVKQIRDPKTQKVVGEEYEMEPLASYVKPYTVVPYNADLNPTQPEQVTMLANQQSADAVMRLVDEGLFEGAYFTAQYEDSRMLVELTDNQRRVSLTGRPCHLETIVGVGQRPFVLPESLPIDKRQPIVVRFTDLSGDNNNIRFQIHGQRMLSEQIRDPRLDRYIRRRRERNRHMSVYMCPLDQDPSIAAATTEDHYFTNDTNIYFEVRKINFKSTLSQGGAAAFKFKVTDEKSNGMQTNWIHSGGALGTAQYPFIYYGPWLIEPGGKVTFTIQNLSAGDSMKLYMTLIGRQHFVVPGP